ncbi:MAG: ATP-binding protein [Acidobacteria bacterium]|nr:ATP-binding protein [Acidobacteriota bacterium]
MITSLEIENLRGIGAGRLEELAPLTILTGPNACGKSAVLDALLIGASPDPGDAVGRAVERHPATDGGSRWLFRKGSRKAKVTLTDDSGKGWLRNLEWLDHCDEGLQEELIHRRSPPPYSMVLSGESEYADEAVFGTTAFGGDNQFLGERRGGRGTSKVALARLVDPGLPVPLHRTFTMVSEAGRRDLVHTLLADLLPGFERLEIIALTDQDFGLAVTSEGRSVPVGLSGDGIQAFIQLALEVAVAPEGLVLVEEPEVYQHPSTLRHSARVLLANLRRGVQTVLTTHSLELIDALVSEAEPRDLDSIALFNLGLEDGFLKSGRRAGEDLRFSRAILETSIQ